MAAAGGPDILTRRGIVETAFAALGKPQRVIAVPAGVMQASAAMLAPFRKRKSELFAFATAVSVSDCVAPQAGSRRLRDYYSELAATA